jgi:DNA replication and repair protein RecF
VRIRSITLQPFRNFDQFCLSLEADRVLIVGRNGHGKSNILEAISYLSIGKSVRGAKDHQVVPHGGQHFDIRALCNDGRRDCQLRIYYAQKEGKRAFCDKNPLVRVSDVLGVLKTVHFSPEDVSLVLRFPDQRRRVLDILISQSSAPYLRDLQRYRRVLTQRNHLLRTSKRTGKILDRGVLQAWSGQLARLGACIRSRRLQALQVLAKPFAEYYDRFSLQQERAAVDYQGPKSRTEEDLCAELLAELERKKDQEQRQGHTLCGPHRDNLVFQLNRQSADSYASEGQLKTILIAWKMAEVRFLEQQTVQQPVLLLDDALSELDAQRAHVLLEMINEFDQVLLTSPRELEASSPARFERIQLPN